MGRDDPEKQLAVSLWFDMEHGKGGGRWRWVQTEAPHAAEFRRERGLDDVARAGLRFALGRDRELTGGVDGAVRRRLTDARSRARGAHASPARIEVDGEWLTGAVVTDGDHFGYGLRVGDTVVKIGGRDPDGGIALQLLRDARRYAQMRESVG